MSHMPEQQVAEDTIRVEVLFQNEAVSVAHIALRGINRLAVNHGSSTTYHVLSGEGTMVIGQAKYVLRQGVVLTAPIGVPYVDSGDVDMIAISTPPFNAASVEMM